MPQEKDKLLDHNFDGIQEYDNPLPRWWVWLFYGSIIFSVIYFPYYHLFGGTSAREEYQMEMSAWEQKQAEQAAVAAANAPAANTSSDGVAQSIGNVDAGKQVFATNCVACHGMLGEGTIGPNLTDSFWIHGNRTEDLLRVVNEGVPDKGMVAWKAILGPQKVQDVVAYLHTLEGTNPPNPKAPEGKDYSSADTMAAVAPAALTGNADSGKQVFTTNCVACHGMLGEGTIGPNLTDNFWIHGNTDQDILQVIANGVPEKGMVAWKTVLNPKKIQDVAVYVTTLKGTNPPNPKAPEGTEYPE